ncbi:MAG: GTP cyclohydrolase I FolE [spirochete symbiont of Stewartia floridana]|nr:MAG: GTP cyclohydrolase I FolE [spirochete symbiont of Stewartia floridana]
MDKNRVTQLTRELLLEIGENPDREGLRCTPDRVAETWKFLTSGYRSNLNSLVNGAIFETEANNMIICRDIEIYSLCEHHLLPFFGTCTIGYIAKRHVMGLSKLARVADHFSRRLQLQERLTAQIAEAVMDRLDATGVGVVINAKHMCMTMRGVEKQNSTMTTSSVLGCFQSDPRSRNEFLTLANG